VPAYGPQNDVTLKMPAFEWVHVQLHQQKGMISLSPPTICNSALETAKPAELQEGMRFAQIEVNMRQWGVFHFDAQLISISERKVIDGKNETITTPRLSFRFLNVSPTVERQLQRIIFSLEREAREKADKVRD
ncbi:hypothetical protein OZI61_24580, partial [Escherichia coli]|nr:hypothetical protein [Escherichia coli]MCZ0581550.1 hypothetical protein [Escherichia coli]